MKNKTEKIIWKAIKDIEDGNVELISIDPINGFLKGSNKFLTKTNISSQTAKYTDNGKPISRPTIDSYKEVIEYLNKDRKVIDKNEIIILKKEIQNLKKELNYQKELNKKIAFENYILKYKKE